MRRHAPRRTRRGFTLIEMMVAVIIGGISVAVAAQIAQVVIRQSAKGRQRTDMSMRARVLGRQIRADLRSAGMGSTGAIAVDPGVAPWTQMSFNSDGGFPAIPAVAVANNAATSIAGRNMRAGSDALQVVVPNPVTLQTTNNVSDARTNQIFVPNAAAFGGCTLVYVADHTAPNGAGRTQILFLTGAGGLSITTRGVLQFTLAPGSDVMCARVSTYWIDDQGWLYRSDIAGGAVQQISPVVFADTSNLNASLTAPGVIDLQIAVRVSAEVYRKNSFPVPPSVRGGWAFEGGGLGADAFLNTDTNWFEVRMIRFHMLTRTMRKIRDGNVQLPIPAMEDGPPHNTEKKELAAEWLSTTEAVTNLRYFDMAVASGTPADPF